MKNTFYLLLALCSLSYSLTAQTASNDFPDQLPVLTSTESAKPFAATITAADMESYLTVLASDEFEGRETGTEGQRKAAEFIAAHFAKLGLPKIVETDDGGSYFQKIAFTSESWKNGQIKLTVNGTKYRHLTDFYAFPSANPEMGGELQADQIIFLGYGIDDPNYSDYKDEDVAGKTILIYSGEPETKRGKSHLTGSKDDRSAWTTDWRKKLEAAHRHGVKAVLIIDPDIKKNISKYRSTLLSSEMKMGEGGKPDGRYANSMFVSSTVAKEIVGKQQMKDFVKLRDRIKKTGKPASMALPCNLVLRQQKSVKQLLGSNVLGFVEGSDPKLKDEIVVVSAHYDHLGKRGESIYNGADDNGSGTSAVMDIAQAFAQAKKEGSGPRRSVLCLLVSGEEKGLLGSEYYAEHPVFPLENTIADVNVDMIGRTDKHHADGNYIYVIGADRLSTELHDINEAANAKHAQLDLDYTYNADDDPNRFYYRSDHYNFAKNGIPSIFYFSGVHQDYHRTSDTVDKIMFEKMEKVARLIFYTTWELANREERIKVNVTGRN